MKPRHIIYQWIRNFMRNTKLTFKIDFIVVENFDNNVERKKNFKKVSANEIKRITMDFFH